MSIRSRFSDGKNLDDNCHIDDADDLQSIRSRSSDEKDLESMSWIIDVFAFTPVVVSEAEDRGLFHQVVPEFPLTRDPHK